MREDGAVRRQAVLVAIGVNGEGRRCVLGVELANRERNSNWQELGKGLRQRGWQGGEFVGSDDHAGVRRAIQKVRPEAVWQRCYGHFLRNAPDYLPRKADDDCRRERHWIYDQRNRRRPGRTWGSGWPSGRSAPQLCQWVEENIKETPSFYRLPRQHHPHLKATHMLERLMEDSKRRTLAVRIFPHVAACVRLIGALAAEMHENRIEATRYLNTEPPAEQNKVAFRRRGEAA